MSPISRSPASLPASRSETDQQDAAGRAVTPSAAAAAPDARTIPARPRSPAQAVAAPPAAPAPAGDALAPWPARLLPGWRAPYAREVAGGAAVLGGVVGTATGAGILAQTIYNEVNGPPGADNSDNGLQVFGGGLMCAAGAMAVAGFRFLAEQATPVVEAHGTATVAPTPDGSPPPTPGANAVAATAEPDAAADLENPAPRA